MFLKWCGKFVLVSVAAIAADFAISSQSQAANASWGCQVLLCAASENPSWHGTPYCVPPMTKLIAAMKLPGFSWPICTEGKAGKPGREDYESCPAGWTAGSSDLASSHSANSLQNVCTRNLGSCNRKSTQNGSNGIYGGVVTRQVYSESGHNRTSCSVIQTQPRKARAKPYYFDIPNSSGVKQRFWFDLNK